MSAATTGMLGAIAPPTAAPARSAGAGVASDASEAAAMPSFASLVAQTFQDAAATGRAGETATIQALGGQASLQDVVQAVNAAEISLQTVVAVRDRMIAAYQEIMRMPI